MQLAQPPSRLCRQSRVAHVEQLRCFERSGTREGKERRWLTTILARINLRLPAPVPLFGLGTSSMRNAR